MVETSSEDNVKLYWEFVYWEEIINDTLKLL